ncbi:MAG: serine/threonine-protein kinase [Polyangiales bacterium]
MTLEAEALAEGAAKALAEVGMPSTASQSIGNSATVAAASPPTMPVTLPEVVTSEDPEAPHADLVVLRVLGQGGMGVVQLARQRSLSREVAVKRLRPGARDGAALLAEATTTGSLEHPNIVPVHALGRDADGAPVMVMKRVEGASLHAMLRDPEHPRWRGADRVTVLVDTLRSLCDAVSFAHSRGVIHRDIKPENVMLGDFGEVYLLDWGVAVKKGHPLPSTAIAGTPAYMAPEMLAPQEGKIDERSDVFLLGATLYEALTGAPPYAGSTIPQVIYQAALCAPKEHPEGVPAELSPILHRCMAREPEARFQSAAALKQALGEVQKHRAAAALVRAAQERLRALDAALASDPATAQVLFHECRFALEQALRETPEHEAAREARERLLQRMFAWEVAQGNRAAAAALMTSLGERPEMVEALAELDRRLARESEERERLARIDYDMDLTVGARSRAVALRGAAVITAAMALVVAVAVLAFGRAPSLRVMGVSSAVLLVMVLGIAVVKRRELFTNRVNRQLAWAVAATAVIVFAHRMLGVMTGERVEAIGAADGFIAAAALAVLGFSVRRLYLAPAALFVAGSFACRLVPGVSVLPLFVATLLSVLLVAAFPPRSASQ